ncbi:LPS-assembly protein LptD [Devosia rhizoryzae]|uniref:LPS-assembly protein LptD n=1 Tax=Devosia rhizoryzae TaxID=2774137 RepID=A0ABX7C6T1_9HYPH|nr:LPS assembly protein LptD [Devosia rhizoryzae]QQR39493.1 LPS-assembly protein LptD [Devosia rhizoryzae]
MPASAQMLVPENFFNAPIDPAAPTAVEADELVFDSVNNIISARGDVVLRLGGYTITGNELVYRRATGDMDVVGDATVTDPAGNVTASPTISLTGGMKRAVLNTMTITAYDGSRITADSADFDRELETILTNAQYAPCGECIDEEGRRIGWSISAARIVQNNEDGSISFEQPTLALLGVPVAWLPYLWLPDLSNEGLDRVPKPSIGYTEQIGLKAEVSFSAYSSRWTDIILTPTLLTNQGFLMGAEWVQRFDNGSMRIKASGLYQFNPDAFTFPDARREWRGAIQAQGEFVPVEEWTAGFAYATFTDSAYFKDYLLEPRRAGINEVYATHLTEDTFVDARVQQYNLLGDTERFNQRQDEQGIAFPNLRVERTFDLPPGAGRIDVEAKMLNIYRAREHTTTVNGIPYDLGYGGTRLHGMTQASWQNQLIFGGAVVTPFAGVRLDAASYDRSSATDLSNPGIPPANQVLLGATPIAALDVRYPLAAYGNGVTHLIEPIAQLVYRGASSTQPGITNEDSQSVFFDDSNLFSYNRFTGIDRQETGLRANLGGRYLLDFNDGNYLELIGGQSFQLAGTNVFAEPNRQQVGVASGLDLASSYAVLGAYGVLADTVKAGGKVQLDTGTIDIARASLGATYSGDLFSAGVSYRYARATPAAGNIRAQHELGGELTVPFADYWSATGQAYWDLSANSFLLAGAGLTYDDGYLSVGGSAVRTGPTHTSPNDTRFLASFRLKAPAGLDIGYSGAVPVVQDWLKRAGTP